MGKTKTEEPPAVEPSVLEEMVNVPTSVKAFGRTYQIGRFTLGQATRALQYIGPFGYLLRSIAQSDGTQVNMGELAITALSISGDSAMGLISVATFEPVEWLEDKDPMDGLEVLATTLERNMSFFSPANIERAKALFARLQARIPSHGGDTPMS